MTSETINNSLTEPTPTPYDFPQTEAEERARMLAMHPALRNLNNSTFAQIIKSGNFGFLWYGPAERPVRFASRAFLEWVNGVDVVMSGNPPQFREPIEWPQAFDFNEWKFSLVSVDDDRIAATYRRDLETERANAN